MNENPWHNLPDSADFVLPCDEALVRPYNEKPGRKEEHLLKFDILPEPFVGNPNAPVLLLSNNPGYAERAHLRKVADFRSRMRKNLLHEPSDYPFLYLAPDLREVGWWWDIKLKHILRIFRREVVARSVLNVVSFPYASNRFGGGVPDLDSQEYSFQLVREAMKRKAVIVFMRKGKRWMKAMPELNGYEHAFWVKNTQVATISPGNCPDYEKVVVAIAAAEVKRQLA